MGRMRPRKDSTIRDEARRILCINRARIRLAIFILAIQMKHIARERRGQVNY
jgi:hypothetical protein